MGKNGHVVGHDNIADALQHDIELLDEISQSQEKYDKSIEVADSSKTEMVAGEQTDKGKLIVEEETAEGHMGWTSCMPIFLGPPAPLCC